MKSRTIVVMACVIFSLILFSFALRQSSSIKGTVTPADKCVRAIAIRDNKPADSVSTTISNGSFEIQNVKAGEYSVVIEATSPYGNARKVGVTVENGKTTDLGEIELQQR